MAEYDGMVLVDPSAPPASGGAFLLSRAAPVGSTEAPAAGWAVEVRAHSRTVVARGGQAGTYRDARDEALGMAQRGLDLISIQGSGDLSVVDFPDNHLVWWVEPSGVVLRVNHISTGRFTMSATVTVLDSAGNPKPEPPRVQAAWDESFRYFRLSQATDDLFDAFRNLYLALESILDSIDPVRLNPKGRPEREGEWLRRAFATAGHLVNLADFAPPGSTDPADALFSDLYVNTRTAIFHAKAGRPHLRPHEASDRPRVQASFERLGRLYLALVDAHLNVRRSSGGVTRAGFDMMTGFLDQNLVVYVVDDRLAPAPPAVPDVAGGGLVPLATRRAPELDEPFLKCLLGQCAAADLAAVPPITRLLALDLSGGAPFDLVMEDSGSLSVEGVDRFEVQLGLRGVNSQQPRRLYGT